MWTKAKVDDAIKTYYSDKARAEHLALEIAELERRIKTAVSNLAGDEAGPKAQRISDMPHGTSVGNPTEELGMKLASGWLPPEVKEMQSDLKSFQFEYSDLMLRVRFVDAWMGALNERERWVIMHQYSQQDTWHNVMTDYQKTYGDFVSKETLKRMRGAAFKKVYRIAEIRS